MPWPTSPGTERPARGLVRSVMTEVRDAILAVLDRETIADLAARPGRADPLLAVAGVTP